ncbi:MAG: flagellar motor protein MotB [Endomicrobiales bacterium]|nr:flagellar motor protein MotB [Endomicrobiales bacterium]
MAPDFNKEFETSDDFLGELGVGEEKRKITREETAEAYGISFEMEWIIHYANLVTILMFFFMILYAFSTMAGSANYEKAMASIQKQMGGDSAQLQRIEKQEKEAEMAYAMEGYIKNKNLAEFAKVETDAQRVKISLSNPILFDLGSSNLKPDAVPALKEIGQLIKNMPNPVIVDGHTDNIPVSGKKFRSNFELSAARAFSVIRYFIDSEKISPERFTAFGYGEFRPLYDNDTEAHRAMNRRIEINIMRQK